MKKRVSSACGPASGPVSGVEPLAVADEELDEELGGGVDAAGGGAACLCGLGVGAGPPVPGVAVVIGGGGGGGRFGGCPVSMARHGVTTAKVAPRSVPRKVPPLRTARGCSPI